MRTDIYVHWSGGGIYGQDFLGLLLLLCVGKAAWKKVVRCGCVRVLWACVCACAPGV